MATGLTKTALIRYLAEKFKAEDKTGSKKTSGPRSHDGPAGVRTGKLSKKI